SSDLLPRTPTPTSNKLLVSTHRCKGCSAVTSERKSSHASRLASVATADHNFCSSLQPSRLDRVLCLHGDPASGDRTATGSSHATGLREQALHPPGPPPQRRRGA